MLPADNAKKKPAPDAAAQIMALDQKKLLRKLKSSKSGDFARAKACQRLAVIGTKDAVPALSALLSDPKLAHYARFGLEPIPDSSVDDALLRALGQLKGRLLAGVIGSIGQRRGAKAVEALARFIDDSDVEVAGATAAALGRIGTPESALVLGKALDHTKMVAGACLECIERLLSESRKEPALALCEALLRRSDLPEPARVQATRLRESLR